MLLNKMMIIYSMIFIVLITIPSGEAAVIGTLVLNLSRIDRHVR